MIWCTHTHTDITHLYIKSQITIIQSIFVCIQLYLWKYAVSQIEMMCYCALVFRNFKWLLLWRVHFSEAFRVANNSSVVLPLLPCGNHRRYRKYVIHFIELSVAQFSSAFKALSGSSKNQTLLWNWIFTERKIAFCRLFSIQRPNKKVRLVLQKLCSSTKLKEFGHGSFKCNNGVDFVFCLRVSCHEQSPMS